MISFKDYNLNPALLEALGYMQFNTPTPIQQEALPIILDGNDLIACAQTGTGKTGAFLIPQLHKLLETESNTNSVKLLIVVPTRELAIQIDQQIDGLAYGTNISSLAIYGGGSGDDFSMQKNAFKEGVDIVIATPGKLISHLNMGYVNFSELQAVVLDEADRMLDIGFHDDIIRIFSALPKQRQTLMFSATMPPKIRTFAKRILKEPKEISIAISKPAEGLMQIAYLAYNEQKTDIILRLLENKADYNNIIIFAPTKKDVSHIVKALNKLGLNAEGISSKLEQTEREKVLLDFRNGKIRILVATDVISRGIDIKNINLVINFTVPKDPEDYVHRIGRTARAASTGIAITFINENEFGNFHKIETLIEKEILKLPPPEDIGEGPTWRAPKQRQKRKK